MNGRKRTEGRTPNLEPRTLLTARSPAKTGTLKNFNLNLLGKSACGSLSPIYHLLASKPLGWWNGRHVRLRGVCRKACGFKSRPEHPLIACFLAWLKSSEYCWSGRQIFSSEEVEQMMTLRDAELIADRLARVHARNMQKYANAPANCSAITCREAAAWSDQLNKLTPSKFLTQLLSRIARIFQWRD